MSVDVTLTSALTVVEVLDGNRPMALDSRAKVTHDQLNTGLALSGGSAVPVTKVAAFLQALTNGAATVDLTALNGTNGHAVNATGLKLQALKVRNPGTNANPISIGHGAANGYEFLGADWKVTLQPGQEVLLYGADAAPDVGSGAKTLDLAGTGTQALHILAVFG